jgi:hypothetical protein
MKTAVISSRQLAEHNRWDAGFHIALAEVKARVEQLRASVTAEEAIAKVRLFPLADRTPLLVLCRGKKPRLRDAGWAIEEYPHLALALMERDLEPTVRRLGEQIAKDQERLSALLDLGKELQYPLAVEDAPPGSWLLVSNGSRGDVAFFRDEVGRFTRLHDGVFLGLPAGNRCRVVTREEAVSSARAYRALGSGDGEPDALSPPSGR